MYASLGIGKVVHVELALMKHTFHVSFANHLGLDRRYCFSVADADIRIKWGVHMSRQMAITRQKKGAPVSTVQQRIRAAAEMVGLVVLRDALIPPLVPGGSELAPAGQTGRMDRSGSVSVVYGTKGKPGPSVDGHQNGERVRAANGFMAETTGKEVVLVCRQNSLLPVMLELLQAGVEPKDRGARF
jgi:hypothetical protein